MKFFKKGSAIFIAGIMLLFCTVCSGLDKLADGLKSGVEQVGNNVAIGKSNALITLISLLMENVPRIIRIFWQPMMLSLKLEKNVLTENGDGSITVQLKSGANYIRLYGTDYDGIIRSTIE